MGRCCASLLPDHSCKLVSSLSVLTCPHRAIISSGDFIPHTEIFVHQSEPFSATSGNWETGCVRFRNNVSKQVKRSVAVLIREGDLILTVRRADNDDELPGVWGLPAGSFRTSESLEELIKRIGQQKLGVALTPIQKLADGTQDRSAYRLQMELWEVSMEGTPNHLEFKWSSREVLLPGMAQGSLCCELALSLQAGKGKSRLSL